MSIALQCAQAITNLQQTTMLNHNSSSLLHIPTSALPLVADALLALCLSLLPTILMVLVFFSCVYICALTCLVHFVDGFPSLFIYLYKGLCVFSNYFMLEHWS